MFIVELRSFKSLVYPNFSAPVEPVVVSVSYCYLDFPFRQPFLMVVFILSLYLQKLTSQSSQTD